VTNRIFTECLKRGLLTMAYAASFRLQPSMTADEQTLSTVAGILEEVFVDMEKTGYWKT